MRDIREEGLDVNIVALVKYSLDVTEIKVDPATRELRTAGVPERVGLIDKNVVEAAVRLKAATGASLKVISLAPAAARDAFKDVLAMGVDEVVLVEDPFGGQAEAGLVVRMLEAAVIKLGPVDVIVCGFASDDGYSFQVGPRLSERLRLPLVAYARTLIVEDGGLKVDQNLDDRLQTVTAALPALVSIDEEAFPPRRTTLMDAIKAKKKPVTIWQAEADLGLPRATLDAQAHVAEVQLTGVVVRRRQQILKGTDLGILADGLIDALEQAGVLKGGA